VCVCVCVCVYLWMASEDASADQVVERSLSQKVSVVDADMCA